MVNYKDTMELAVRNLDKLKKLLHFLTTPEMILYIVFGVATTVINILVCGLCYDILHWNILAANTVAWILAVIFAFITNKLYVFQSKSFEKSLFLRELVTFMGARLLSLGVDSLGMWLLVEQLGGNVWIAKVLMNVIVIIMNYVLSKLIIFKK
jgi:putative flippase GtrA